MSFVYRGQPGPVLRATVGVALLAGVLMSLTAVTLAGRWEPTHALLALALVPAALLGFVASYPINRRLDRAALRRFVLVLGAIAGVATIIDALVG